MIFEDAIADLELKYADILNKHLNIITGEYPDSLDNHFKIMGVEKNKRQLEFYPKSYLSSSVREDILSAFKICADSND
jgi:hypothetical protein